MIFLFLIESFLCNTCWNVDIEVDLLLELDQSNVVDALLFGVVVLVDNNPGHFTVSLSLLILRPEHMVSHPDLIGTQIFCVLT